MIAFGSTSTGPFALVSSVGEVNGWVIVAFRGSAAAVVYFDSSSVFSSWEELSLSFKMSSRFGSSNNMHKR